MEIKELRFEDREYSNGSITVKVYIGNICLFSIENEYYNDKYYYFMFNAHLPSVIVSYLPEKDVRIAPINNKFNTLEEAKEESKKIIQNYINNFII